MSHYEGSVPTTPRAKDWRDDGLCQNEAPDAFFASPLTAEGKQDVRHAKTVCFRCPSRLACGEWALETREPFGVWGGMTEAERRAVLRQRAERERRKQAAA